MAGGRHSSNWKDKRNSFDDYNPNLGNPNTDYYDDEDEEINYKKVAIVVTIVVVLILVGILVYNFIIKKPAEEENLPENTTNNETMVETVGGYDVLGQIKIESINVEQYILDSTDSDALESGVGKIDNGASINNYGNFCLAGHNNNNIFEKLDELQTNDEIILVDKNMEETTYVITDIFETEPDNLECLLQDENKIELTLITCQNGATTRLVVKAEEKEV